MTTWWTMMLSNNCSIHGAKEGIQAHQLLARSPSVDVARSMPSVEVSIVQSRRWWLLSVAERREQIVVFTKQHKNQTDILAANPGNDPVFADVLLQSLIPLTTGIHKALIDRRELIVGSDRLPDHEVQRLLEGTLSPSAQLRRIFGCAGLIPDWCPTKEAAQSRCFFEVAYRPDAGNDRRCCQWCHTGQRKQDLPFARSFDQPCDLGFQHLSMFVEHAQFINELALLCDQASNAPCILCSDGLRCFLLELGQLCAAWPRPGSTCAEIVEVSPGDSRWRWKPGTQVECSGPVGVFYDPNELREQFVADRSQAILTLSGIVYQFVSTPGQAAQRCRCFAERESWAYALVFVQDLDVEFDLAIQCIRQAQCVQFVRLAAAAHALCWADLVDLDTAFLQELEQSQMIVASALQEHSANTQIVASEVVHCFDQLFETVARIFEEKRWAAVKSPFAEQFAMNEARCVVFLGNIDANVGALRGGQHEGTFENRRHFVVSLVDLGWQSRHHADQCSTTVVGFEIQDIHQRSKNRHVPAIGRGLPHRAVCRVYSRTLDGEGCKPSCSAYLLF